MNFERFVEFSPTYPTPLKFAFAQHFLALLLTAFLLDGGAMLRASLFAVAAHWVIIIIVMLRRPLAPIAFDLGSIRLDFVLPVAIVAGVVAGLLGRTPL